MPLTTRSVLGRPAAGAHRVRGVSLIEMLVAVLVLSFGMLAMAGLHASSLKLGKMAQFRAVAQQLADDYVDRMRAGTLGLTQAQAALLAPAYYFQQAYDPAGALPAVPACVLADQCTGAELAARDQARWRRLARLSLPGGSLYVQPVAAGSPVVEVTVVWRDPQAVANGETGGECPAAMAAPDPAPSCLLLRATLW
jgi:type IV pilus assembly protein PilV